jgi:hypothetical protein
MRYLLLLALTTSLLRADTLADLKAKLATMNGNTRVTAMITYEFASLGADENQPVKGQGKASAAIEDGPDGIRITWPRELIAAIDQEARDAAKNPEKKNNLRRAAGGINPMLVHDNLSAAAGVLRQLEEAEFVAEQPDTWEGQPARLLTLKLPLPKNPQARKYIKDWNATAKVWVGADNLPLAAEMRVQQKGRAFLVITFEGEGKEDFRFAAVGQRLVIVRHAKESSASNPGQKNHDTSLITIKLNPGAGG